MPKITVLKKEYEPPKVLPEAYLDGDGDLVVIADGWDITIAPEGAYFNVGIGEDDIPVEIVEIIVRPL